MPSEREPFITLRRRAPRWVVEEVMAVLYVVRRASVAAGPVFVGCCFCGIDVDVEVDVDGVCSLLGSRKIGFVSVRRS